MEGEKTNKDTTTKHWEALEDVHNSVLGTQVANPLMKASQEVYESFISGIYGIKDVKTKTLSGYFPDDAALNLIQKAEKNILSHNGFDLKNDCYISIPLVGFIEFDGVAHIIFDSKVSNLFTPEKKGELIVRFSTEYEGLFLDWGAIGDKENSIIQFIGEEAFSTDFDKENPNPFIKALNYQKRYKRYKAYYDFRLKESNEIPKKLYTQYLRQALTAILIDSYAHNISAHSLTALAWWFRKRADLQDLELSPLEIEGEWDNVFELLTEFSDGLNEGGIKDLCADLEAIRNKKINNTEGNSPDSLEKSKSQFVDQSSPTEGRPEEGAPIVHFKGHLSRELAPLFNFLMEKGAYWSGITRDQNIGGKVSSLFSVLWYNFINNPLYLGTIAKTEDIHKIIFKVVEYEPERITHDKVTQSKRTIKSQGLFATVDLNNPRKTPIPKGTKEWLKTRSIFVEPESGFETMKKALEQARLYFPGGVVGKHALFTMIENEIRNVKHYHGEALKNMHQEGLTLEIGIQPCFLPYSNKKEGEAELYKISIGINAPTVFGEIEGKHLVLRKWESLNSELTENKTHSPKLGGTFQDKVCAALLFNSSFSSAQNGYRGPGTSRDFFDDTSLQKAFFPWVIPSCRIATLESKEITEYGITLHNAENINTDIFEFPEIGHSFKNFYMWRGADINNISVDQSSLITHTNEAENDVPWENYSRFRILTVEGQNAAVETLRLRREGAVRIIDGHPDMADNKEAFVEAYRRWLRIWVNAKEYAFLIQEKGKNQALLALTDDGKCRAFAHDALNKNPLDEDVTKCLTLATSNPKNCVLEIAHSADQKTPYDTLKYRSHGTYKSYFLGGSETFTDVVKNHKDKLFELFEVLATRICIFDNRIWHRIREDIDRKGGPIRDHFYKDKLRLSVHAEGTIKKTDWHMEWDETLPSVIPDCNFLVLHLSFIEALLNKKYAGHSDYKPGNIGLFIEQELKPYISDSQGKIRENFFLVITTGRGNSNWLESLNEERYNTYFKFTMFRPIETLLSAVDNSISQQDDIELKYRLCKVLFGS